jgi:ferritin-like metal-binding protein YciE
MADGTTPTKKSTLDTAANIAIIVVCAIAAVVLIRNQFFPPAPPPRPGEVAQGDQLPVLQQAVPAGADRALVMALAPGCHFCTESMPFYKRLIDERNQKGSDVKVVAAVSAPDAKAGEMKIMADAGVKPDAVVELNFQEAKVAGTPTLLLVDNKGEVLDVWVGKLDDIYSAEKQILQALPRMAKKTKNPELKKGFEMHVEQTRIQIERLDRIFEMLGKSSRGKKCKGMEGLIEEGKEMMQEDMEPEVLDAALIAAAQKVEHYEIAAYGTVRTYANLLGEKEHVKILQETLNEEGEMDKQLTRVAEAINVEAMVEA